MPTSRVVLPETIRIELTGGDWIEIKQRLNAGEMIALFDMSADPERPGMIDERRAGVGLIVSYVVAWSMVGPDGTPIRIDGADAMRGALLSFDWDTFNELLTAVRTHDAARREEKKRRADGIGSSPLSISLAAAGGGTSGF